ncbi:MAG: hypothetical protein WCC87_11710 [Candidatus Korobacteraceae bacterium]
MASSLTHKDREIEVEVTPLKEELRALTDVVQQLRAQLQEQSKMLAELSGRVAGTAAAEGQPAQAAEEEVSPDTLLIIAAAVTAFLGKKVRIRSARRLESPYEIINPWAQQGRVLVQASHLLRREG